MALTEAGKLTQKATMVFTEIFFRFSPSGKMMPEELARFVEESTSDSCLTSDSRITGVFERFDEDKDGILSLQDFLNFFEDSSRFREGVVWRNLEVLRYRNDLEKDEAIVEESDYHLMVRYRLYKHQ
ncbi:MAG: hypothetical protein JST59_00460 [Actinobacteria bacterium]|nr:hypothetical protein [Actinomycetota bacterium]